MSAVYKIIGADGRQYGPVAAGQIRQWIAEGRVESRTPVFTDGAKDWTFAGLLPEFANCFPPTTPPLISPPAPGAAGQLPRTNSFATAGLVCGILSLICCCGFPFCILGVIFSLVALSEIRRHPGLYEGHGMAIAGLILSVASLVLRFGLLLYYFALTPPTVMWHYKHF